MLFERQVEETELEGRLKQRRRLLDLTSEGKHVQQVHYMVYDETERGEQAGSSQERASLANLNPLKFPPSSRSACIPSSGKERGEGGGGRGHNESSVLTRQDRGINQ